MVLLHINIDGEEDEEAVEESSSSEDVDEAEEVEESAWGYGEYNGPATWSQWYPIAETGRRQSPINIDTSSEVADVYDEYIL